MGHSWQVGDSQWVGLDGSIQCLRREATRQWRDGVRSRERDGVVWRP